MTLDTRRPVPEWVGKKPTTKAPQSVYLRLWERQGGRCAISGNKMYPGDEKDVDHIIPLRDGGQNKESNLQIVLRSEHRKKTAAENKQRAYDDRVKAGHRGLKKPSRNPLPGGRGSKWKKKMDGTVVPRDTPHCCAIARKLV